MHTLRASLELWSGLDTVSLLPGLLGAGVPVMWLLLAGEVAADHAVKLTTTRLIGETSALSVTLLMTLQRFLALVVSAAVLSPTPPEPTLWAGLLLVGLGSAAYALGN